jgi:hypothetical protein
MKRKIPNILTSACYAGLFICLTLAQPISANAMAMANHINGLGDLGGMADLIGTPANQGGAGIMTIDELFRVSQWMDDPALKAGQYKNQLAGGGLLCPANHNWLRHNPSKVAKVFSGDGSVDAAVRNAAAAHKIQDVAYNSRPVDGVEITSKNRSEARKILRHVKENGKLPDKLPRWVDERGQFATKSEIVVEETAANATSAGEMLAGKIALSGAAMTVVAGIDGGVDLYDGIKNNSPEKTLSGTVKSGAAVTMGVGIATCQPEVVVPAAIVYGGAVVTDVAYEHREAIGDAVYATSEATKELANNIYLKERSGFSVASEICANATTPMRGKIDGTASIIYERGQQLHDWLFP